MPDDNPDVKTGASLLEAGDPAGAVHLLETVAATEPENGLAFLYLGVARSQAGDLDGGAAALRRAAQLLPDRAGVWYNLGVALTKVGEAREAQAALRKAISLDPGHTKARTALEAIAPQPPDAAPTAAAAVPTAPAAAPAVPQLRQMTGLADAGVGAVPGNGLSGVQDDARLPVSGPVGVRYVPATPQQRTDPLTNREAPAGVKILRGLGWGFVCGQWWTLLNTFWHLVGGGASHGFAPNALLIAIFVFVFGIAGSIAGLIIAATNARGGTGAIVGVVTGLLLFAAEFFLLDGANPSMLFNAFFWFFTGRYVGANIASRVHGRQARPMNRLG